MIQAIVDNPLFLALPSDFADAQDLKNVVDLVQTMNAHPDCVGIAGNMIGCLKKIIVFESEDGVRTMLNPEITAQKGPYTAQEGCLCHKGQKTVTRYQKISVRFQDMQFHWHEEDFSGFTAQIIQHEIDHTKGILI